jgi:hypothetical protein
MLTTSLKISEKLSRFYQSEDLNALNLSAPIHNYGHVLAVIFFYHRDTEDIFLYALALMLLVYRRLPANEKLNISVLSVPLW